MSTITINEQAEKVVRDMERQAIAVARAWHFDPAIVASTYASLTRCLTNLLTSGDVSISRDGELSLYGVSFIHFGVIYFGKHRPDAAVPTDPDVTGNAPYTGRYCMAVIEDGNPRYCAHPYVKGEPTCAGHQPITFTMPVPGEWSMHS